MWSRPESPPRSGYSSCVVPREDGLRSARAEERVVAVAEGDAQVAGVCGSPPRRPCRSRAHQDVERRVDVRVRDGAGARDDADEVVPVACVDGAPTGRALRCRDDDVVTRRSGGAVARRRSHDRGRSSLARRDVGRRRTRHGHHGGRGHQHDPRGQGRRRGHDNSRKVSGTGDLRGTQQKGTHHRRRKLRRDRVPGRSASRSCPSSSGAPWPVAPPPRQPPRLAPAPRVRPRSSPRGPVICALLSPCPYATVWKASIRRRMEGEP